MTRNRLRTRRPWACAAVALAVCSWTQACGDDGGIAEPEPADVAGRYELVRIADLDLPAEVVSSPTLVRQVTDGVLALAPDSSYQIEIFHHDSLLASGDSFTAVTIDLGTYGVDGNRITLLRPIPGRTLDGTLEGELVTLELEDEIGQFGTGEAEFLKTDSAVPPPFFVPRRSR